MGGVSGVAHPVTATRVRATVKRTGVPFRAEAHGCFRLYEATQVPGLNHQRSGATGGPDNRRRLASDNARYVNSTRASGWPTCEGRRHVSFSAYARSETKQGGPLVWLLLLWRAPTPSPDDGPPYRLGVEAFGRDAGACPGAAPVGMKTPRAPRISETLLADGERSTRLPAWTFSLAQPLDSAPYVRKASPG
jgi:hypothetical protein